MQPAGGRALAHPGSATLQTSAISECNASGGPGPALQPVGGRALAHPASATLHTRLKVIFQREGNASGGPGPALQPAGGSRLGRRPFRHGTRLPGRSYPLPPGASFSQALLLLVVAGCTGIGQHCFWRMQIVFYVIGGCKLCWNWLSLFWRLQILLAAVRLCCYWWLQVVLVLVNVFWKVADFASCSQALMLLVVAGCACIGQRFLKGCRFCQLQSCSNVILGRRLCWHWSVLLLKVADFASCNQTLMLLMVAGCAGSGQPLPEAIAAGCLSNWWFAWWSGRTAFLFFI